MFRDQKTNFKVATGNKVELILLLQTHTFDTAKDDSKMIAEKKEEVIYSQLNLMKIISEYKNAAIVCESGLTDVNASSWDDDMTKKYRFVFPEYKDLQKIDFNNLTSNQRIVLEQNMCVTILFHLRVISEIYQCQNTSKVSKEVMYNQYVDAYNKHLIKYPDIQVELTRDKNNPNGLKPIPVVVQNNYLKFLQEVRADAPIMFLDREEEALNFVLRAAQKSGKKQVLLIIGKNHEENIIALVNNKFKDTIVLTTCINSSVGILHETNENYLKSLNQEAIKNYKDKKLSDAIINFRNIYNFWNATPNTTPKKDESLLSVTYNLGSAFLQLTKEGEPQIDNAIHFLGLAAELSKQLNEGNDKYKNRYEEAMKCKQ